MVFIYQIRREGKRNKGIGGTFGGIKHGKEQMVSLHEKLWHVLSPEISLHFGKSILERIESSLIENLKWGCYSL